LSLYWIRIMSADMNLTDKKLPRSYLNEEISCNKWEGYFVKLKTDQISAKGQKITSGRAMFRASLIFSRKHARLGNPPGCK